MPGWLTGLLVPGWLTGLLVPGWLTRPIEPDGVGGPGGTAAGEQDTGVRRAPENRRTPELLTRLGGHSV